MSDRWDHSTLRIESAIGSERLRAHEHGALVHHPAFE